MTAFAPGDRVSPKYRSDRPLEPTTREIVDVRLTGYGWKYPEYGSACPDGSENYFWSENSSDPKFDRWELVTATEDPSQ